MIKVRDLSVSVKYRVGLGDVEVPDNVYEQLKEMFDNGDEVDFESSAYPEAAEWINENIKEADSCDYAAEVFDISSK